ncbi:type II secretion system F family protein [Planctomycetota bacterium]
MSVLDGGYGRRSRFYDDLSISLDAGLDFSTTLKGLGEHSDLYGRWARGADAKIASGETFSEALAGSGSLDRMEHNLVEAGERAGKLPEVLRKLSEYFDMKREIRESVVQGLIYPTILVHLTVLLPPLYLIFTEGTRAYLLAIAAGFLVLYGVAGAVYALYRVARGRPTSRLVIDSLLLRTPVLGRAIRTLGSADYAHILGLMYGSGIRVIESLERAAESVSNGVIAESARRVAHRVRAEEKTLADAFAPEAGVLPRILVESIRTGEVSGQLDRTLERVSGVLRHEGERYLKFLAQAAPMALYLMVAGYIAYLVVSFYTNLYSF